MIDDFDNFFSCFDSFEISKFFRIFNHIGLMNLLIFQVSRFIEIFLQKIIS